MADFRKIQALHQTGPQVAPKTATRATERKETSIWNREIEFGSSFGGKEKQQFFHLLAVMMEAGLSITESLEIVRGQLPKQKSRAIISKLEQALQEGFAFSEAAAQQPDRFSTLEVYSIRMGERAGQMIQVLHDLALYHEKRLKLQRKLTQALSYPIVVLTIAGGVLFFMINYVVPMFRDIFTRFDAQLPKITELVIALSDFTTQNGLWPLLVMGLMIGLILRFRRHAVVRKASTAMVVRIPIMGKLIVKIQLARFCYTLALMLRSKVSLDQALELLAELIQFPPIQRAIPLMRKDVTEGKTLHEAISAHSIFPPVMLQMVRVGERTARLDTMMGNLAKTMDDEAEASISTLTSLLEPILIVILGLMVGVILVSMYLPMFELSNTINA